ncbi:MAG: glycosyltransferase family 2 protein [Candidatus Binatia bacterium]
MSESNVSFPVSLLVITHNEENNIARCLDSVPFVSEKLVVDSGSTDRTREVAQQHGARVVDQAWLGFGPQRNFASEQAAHDWILFLDADEALSDSLVREFRQRLPDIIDSKAAGAMLPRSAWYMGEVMRWYRPMVGEMKGRFYHRRRARWTDTKVHESLVFEGRVLRFRRPFNHYQSPSLVHKQLKVLRYAELWAIQRVDGKRKPRVWTYPFVFLGTFLKDYLLRLAFLDGRRGVIAAHVAANYAVYKRFRHFELVRNPDSRRSASELLDEHRLRI